MKKLLGVLLAATLLVSGYAAESDDNSTSGNSALIGTWNLTSMTVGGVEHDLSGFSVTSTYTASSYTTTFSDGCTEAGTLTTSGNTVTTTVTSVTGCSEYYGKVVGTQVTDMYTVSGTTLTNTGTDRNGISYIQVWTKV